MHENQGKGQTHTKYSIGQRLFNMIFITMKRESKIRAIYQMYNMHEKSGERENGKIFNLTVSEKRQSIKFDRK